MTTPAEAPLEAPVIPYVDPQRRARSRARARRDGVIASISTVVVFAVLAAGAGWMYPRSQQHKVDSSNVNAEWDRPQDLLDQHAPDHAGTHEVPTADLIEKK